ncbi:MAG: RnfABCDGE type electron transport complex subunit D [Candidatus Doudnabacteria bacterium]|nr:RnfABCDGE type electron transport complex subunit D [Candidatus Doudnabacteria bacterium]
MKPIDNLLNRITMYRLVLYYLLVLLAAALFFCTIKVLPYSGLQLFQTTLILLIVSLAVNKIISSILKIPVNAESDYITAFILALIITPGSSIWFLVVVAAVAQASKYILAYRGKHIFNPAAVAVLIAYYAMQQGASWWIGGVYMLPFVVIGGFLVIRKIQRFDLTLSLLTVVLAIYIFQYQGSGLRSVMESLVVNSSLLFFTFVMLTEPMSSPARRTPRIIYGAIVGFFYSTNFNLGNIYMSPELALILGNVFSFIVSSKGRVQLMLKSQLEIASSVVHFNFQPSRSLVYQPGQYMDWTLDPQHSDTRGNRRYFTIASSPTEQDVMLGVKFYEKPSTFKQKLRALEVGRVVMSGQVAGDFTLPKDKTQKLIFIAGGIGITPFRSMIKYLIDQNEKRDIVLFYSNKNETEVVYKEILDEAGSKLGVKIVYVLTDKVGYLNAEMIKAQAPDFNQRIFMISGPRSMVVAFEDLLKSLGVAKHHIKVDFFPGFV